MRFSALVISSLLLSGTFATAQTSFTTPAIYPAPAGYSIVRSADFNHDEKPDLLIQSDQNAQNFALYLNDGTGKFGAPTLVPNNNLGIIANSVIGDVNGDGFPDIVALEGDGLVVYLNDGTGNFTATLQQPTERYGTLVLGDVNQDGHIDVIVGPQNSNSLETFFGDGTGKFGPPVTQTNINLDIPSTGNPDTTNCTLDRMTGGNFFLDNQFSLFVTATCVGSGVQNSGTIFLAHGDGTGHFTFTPSSALGGQVGLVTTINGSPSGKPNVVYTVNTMGNGYQQLHLATNNGGGNFTNSLIDDTGSTGYGFVDIAVADFNGDGIPDLATTASIPDTTPYYSSGPALVSLYAGSAGGAFTTSTSISVGDANTLIRDIAAADFNGDGHVDLGTLALETTSSANVVQLYVYDSSNVCAAPTAANSNLICTPANGATTTSPITVTAASNVSGFTLNRLYLDNTSVYQVAAQMVNTSITAANGTHTLVLVSYNNAGKAFSTSTTFTVGTSTHPPPPGGCLPTVSGVSICAPTSGSTAASPVTITAGALTKSGNITAIRAYIDNVAVFTTNNPAKSTSQQVSQSVTVAAGSHKLTVVGYESTGSSLTTTESFTVGASAACYPSSAGAKICAPASGATVSSPLTFVAGATAGSGYITAVRIYVDNVSKATVNNSAKSASFAINTPLTIAAGKHNVVVVGYQSSGGSVSTSESITIQ